MPYSPPAGDKLRGFLLTGTAGSVRIGTVCIFGVITMDPRPYTLSCESTVDLPYSYVCGRDMAVLFYSYTALGQKREEPMGRDPEAMAAFYRTLEQEVPVTSQLNAMEYIGFFTPLLRKGDVLHVTLGSGMTNSVANARQAAEQLREEFPDRRITVIDSLCTSTGYGMLMDYAADLRDAGFGMDELAEWIAGSRLRIHHQFFSTDLKYFRRSGRVSGAAAAIGTALNFCPVMRLDDEGRIVAYDRIRGEKAAVRHTVEQMLSHAEGGADYSGKCFICHSDSPRLAGQLLSAVKERFPHIRGEIRVCEIGAIIASHCGPGTVAVLFYGDERKA